MSIVRCDNCEQTVDLDYEQAEPINNDKWLCGHCYEEYDR